MFTKQDLQNILAFLSKTQITGQDAALLVQLQMKISQELQKPEVKQGEKSENTKPNK